MKRYRLTGMLDASGFVEDPEGMFVLYTDVVAADELARAAAALRAHVSGALPSGSHLVPGWAVNAYDAALAAHPVEVADRSTDEILDEFSKRYGNALRTLAANPVGERGA